MVVPCLKPEGIAYDFYFSGTRSMHDLREAVTVALGVPHCEERQRARPSLLPLAGAATSIGIAITALVAAGPDRLMVASCAPSERDHSRRHGRLRAAGRITPD